MTIQHTIEGARDPRATRLLRRRADARRRDSGGQAQADTSRRERRTPGFTISLKKAGAKVTSLKPGAYVIRVSDKSAFHNFHITGPGVNKATGVAFVGNRSFPVALKRGTYRYVCDPHRRELKGSFTVR